MPRAAFERSATRSADPASARCWFISSSARLRSRTRNALSFSRRSFTSAKPALVIAGPRNADVRVAVQLGRGAAGVQGDVGDEPESYGGNWVKA